MKVIEAEVSLYQMRNNDEISVKAAASLTANILRSGPMYVQTLLGGMDGDKPSLYSLDPAGGMIKDTYISTGSGSIVAYGTLSQEEGGTIEVIAADSTLGYDAQQTRNEVKKMEVKVEFGNMYTKELDSFGRSSRDGAPVEVPAADAVWAQRIIKAAYESQETDKIVTL
jgi:predicted dehydrogenase